INRKESEVAETVYISKKYKLTADSDFEGSTSPKRKKTEDIEPINQSLIADDFSNFDFNTFKFATQLPPEKINLLNFENSISINNEEETIGKHISNDYDSSFKHADFRLSENLPSTSQIDCHLKSPKTVKSLIHVNNKEHTSDESDEYQSEIESNYEQKIDETKPRRSVRIQSVQNTNFEEENTLSPAKNSSNNKQRERKQTKPVRKTAINSAKKAVKKNMSKKDYANSFDSDFKVQQDEDLMSSNDL
ncbi:unnamed protein product, partial [Brachionus calyciflorus]